MGKYRKYRSYGHTRFTSASLAIPIELILGLGAVVGLIVGLRG